MTGRTVSLFLIDRRIEKTSIARLKLTATHQHCRTRTTLDKSTLCGNLGLGRSLELRLHHIDQVIHMIPLLLDRVLQPLKVGPDVLHFV